MISISTKDEMTQNLLSTIKKNIAHISQSIKEAEKYLKGDDTHRFIPFTGTIISLPEDTKQMHRAAEMLMTIAKLETKKDKE
jgi:hypothetical protein